MKLYVQSAERGPRQPLRGHCELAPCWASLRTVPRPALTADPSLACALASPSRCGLASAVPAAWVGPALRSRLPALAAAEWRREGGCGRKTRGGQSGLKLGKAWSDVPDGCTLPEGAEVRIDMESGRKQARLAESTAASVNDVQGVNGDMGALGCETLAADAEPGAQAVELTPMEALTFAARFDPPEHLRKKFRGTRRHSRAAL